MTTGGTPTPPRGWHYDDDTGALMRDTIHRMGRRCHNWDYSCPACYQVTLVLAERQKALLGELRFDEARGGAYVALSPLGAALEALARRFAEFTPEIDVLGVMVMPDHLHLVLRALRRLPVKKPLGIALRGFKGGATKLYWQHGGQGPLFAQGFVDTILFDDAAIAHELAYLADNPRRLWEKRAHPELFRVLRDLPITLFTATSHRQFRRDWQPPSALGAHDTAGAVLAPILRLHARRQG